MIPVMKRPLPRILVVAVTGTFALSSCAASPPTAPSEVTEGVPFDTTKEEWIAAFADVDPIELYAQVSGAQGAFGSKKEEDYLAAVEEYSGGKIKFDITYALGAAGPTEVDDALEEGRLDIALALPVYEPAKYPIYSQLLTATVLVEDGDPVHGPLHSIPFLQEIAFSTPGLIEEFESAGMFPLIPFNTYVPNTLVCNSSRTSAAQLAGAVSAAATPTVAKHLETIGVAPTSLTFNEVYEGLQRGVVDCTATSLIQASTSGLIEVAPFSMVSDSASLSNGAGSWALSLETWRGLPLVAQQLLIDRVDAFFRASIVDGWQATAAAVQAMEEQGGGVQFFDDDVTQELREENEATLAAWGDAARHDLVTGSAQSWSNTVHQIAGVESEVTYANFVEWWHANGDEISARFPEYIDTVFERVFSERRPS